MNTTITVQLRTGTLQVTAHAGDLALTDLLGFASRINSPRGFLLVSKVLGKHYPVTPATMAYTYQLLSEKILATGFDAPALWIGMAETATGLGYGVYEAALATGMASGLFMQTTRYHLAGYDALDFVEAHSHAADFYLYWPTQAAHRHHFSQARRLVLIDDEISTGATFARLIQAYRAANPALEEVIIASLVNFASAAHRQAAMQAAGVPIRWVSLLEGQWRFTPASPQPTGHHDPDLRSTGDGHCKRHLIAWPGRTGLDQAITLSASTLTELTPFLPATGDSRPVLVLGTGECNAPAFLLGRALDHSGHAVIIQATTRSPIYVEGAIVSKLRFTDNYQEAIHNYLYNVDPERYARVIVCHETPLVPGKDTHELDFIGALQHLNAISAQVSYQQGHAQFSFHRPG
ncbi:MAG: phosphoribosyltransferase domain-containing protein [Methylococcales bacterium]|nr:phosphoribosyltransferase domain-containing protein [Methylococcales bacterium]